MRENENGPERVMEIAGAGERPQREEQHREHAVKQRLAKGTPVERELGRDGKLRLDPGSQEQRQARQVEVPQRQCAARAQEQVLAESIAVRLVRDDLDFAVAPVAGVSRSITVTAAPRLAS